MKKTLKRVVSILCVALLAFGLVLSCASSGGGGGGGGAKSGSTLEGKPSDPVGGYRIFVDDGNDGSSTAELTAAEETIGGQTATVYTIKGNVTTQYQYGYAGWAFDPDPDTLELLKSAKGFSFKVLGDGKKYAIKYKTSDCDSDYCYYEYVFDTKADGPTTVEVPMKFFNQPSWGQWKKLNVANFTGMEWQTHESWRQAGDNNPFEIKFWDLKVYN